VRQLQNSPQASLRVHARKVLLLLGDDTLPEAASDRQMRVLPVAPDRQMRSAPLPLEPADLIGDLMGEEVPATTAPAAATSMPPKAASADFLGKCGNHAGCPEHFLGEESVVDHVLSPDQKNFFSKFFNECAAAWYNAGCFQAC
jgi:hypothetical protein